MFRAQTDRQSNPKRGDPGFRHNVLKGLSLRPTAISARWFYGPEGSALVEAITQLPEYYPTRIERSVLLSGMGDIAALAEPGRIVVEFGSDSSAKTLILPSEMCPEAYVPIDISGEFLGESVQVLSRLFPGLPTYCRRRSTEILGSASSRALRSGT
jgi:L-histidine Nalpha-methyltransferase